MTVKMILVKGPVLRKLLVLTLLTFAGIGYPPEICEAILCHECGVVNEDGDEVPSCESGHLQTGSCPGDLCLIAKLKDTVTKGCQRRDFSESDFDCAQEKLGQTGNCVEGTVEEYGNAILKCRQGERSSGSDATARHLPVKSGGSQSGQKSIATARAPELTDYVKNCKCRGDLCNTDSILNAQVSTTKPKTSSSSTEGLTSKITTSSTPTESENGQFGGTERLGFQKALGVGAITLLAINGLFY